MGTGTEVTHSSSGSQETGTNPVADNEWTQHTADDGRTFWYNTASKKSTWDKPDSFKTDLERLMATQTAWKEYTSVDGRPYWYNKETKTSVWTCPEEIEKLKDEISCDWTSVEDKSTARDRLKTLLKLKGVGLRTRFEDALNLIKNDSRYELFSGLTTGEKKQIFSEYQSQIQKQQREKERAKKVEARKVFLEILTNWPLLHPAALLSSFQEEFGKEWWFLSLPSSEREDLFNDFIDDNQVQFQEEQRTQRTHIRREMSLFLKESPLISVDLKWASALDILLDQPQFATAEPRDLLMCWEEYVYDTDQAEKELQRLAIQRSRRKKRDAFRFLIEDEIKNGNLHARVIFPEFIESHQDHPAYLNLIGVPLAVPREIFDRAIDPLLESYEEQKIILKNILKTKEIRVTPTTLLDEFITMLQSEALDDTNKLSEINCKLFFESLKRRAIRRDREKHRFQRSISVTNESTVIPIDQHGQRSNSPGFISHLKQSKPKIKHDGISDDEEDPFVHSTHHRLRRSRSRDSQKSNIPHKRSRTLRDLGYVDVPYSHRDIPQSPISSPSKVRRSLSLQRSISPSQQRSNSSPRSCTPRRRLSQQQYIEYDEPIENGQRHSRVDS